MAEPNGSLICWIDTETTGKHADRGLLLEVSMIITNNDLTPLVTQSYVIKHDPDVAKSYADEYVLNMHDISGLWKELEHGIPLEEAELRLIEAVDEASARIGKAAPLVAGNSVSFDRKWLEAHMPKLNENHLHYRNIDVSTVKELARRYSPEMFENASEKNLGHRGLADVRESIEEMRHYLSRGLFQA